MKCFINFFLPKCWVQSVGSFYWVVFNIVPQVLGSFYIPLIADGWRCCAVFLLITNFKSLHCSTPVRNLHINCNTFTLEFSFMQHPTYYFENQMETINNLVAMAQKMKIMKGGHHDPPIITWERSAQVHLTFTKHCI